MRIEKLTPAQQERMPEWVAKWIAIGLSTEPADFGEAERGVRGCYSAAGLPEPIVVRVESPLVACMAGPIASKLLREGSAVDSAVHSAVRSAVNSAVRSAVHSAVRSAVNSAVDSAVHSAVDSAVRSAWAHYRGGNLWSAWYAYVSFFRDVCDWQHPSLEAFAHDERHALNAGWCWSGQRVAMISDRPQEIHLVENRLHSETGPSISWRDSWELWHIDGVRVDEQIVMRPDSQTVKQIHGEKNAEVQRIRIERFGWPRYLAESGASVIDERRNDIDGTREALVESQVGQRRLVCACPSTAKVFAMHVPREIQTCDQAQRWLAGGRSVRVVGAS